MSVQTGPEIVGFGAGALDVYRPQNEVGPDYKGGAKISQWTEKDDELLVQLLDSGSEQHVGGNAPNALAYLATLGLPDKRTGLVTALGQGDMASEAIRLHAPHVNIETEGLVVTHNGYLPSVSIVERKDGDRMVRGRPRTPLDAFISDEHIATASADAELLVVASLKSVLLARRVFANTPQDAYLSFNPGSSEFRDHPGELLEVMKERNPQMLALNDDEIRQLFGASEQRNPEDLARIATEYSENVLCTLGAKGILLAQRGLNGQVYLTRHEATPLEADKVVDTLGAGDRAHGVAIAGSFEGKAGRLILQEVAESTRELIQHTGAHGDRYDINDLRIQENRAITTRLPLSVAA